MNKEDIIELIKNKGMGLCSWGALTVRDGKISANIATNDDSLHPCLWAFFDAAFAVGAAAEREACAKECAEILAEHGTAAECIAAIRARGEK